MASITQLPVKAKRVKSIFDSDDDSDDEVDVCGQNKYEDLIKEKNQNGEDRLTLKETSVSSSLEISKCDDNIGTTKIDKQSQLKSKPEPAQDNPKDIVFDSDSDSHPQKSLKEDNNSDSDSNFPISKGNEEDTEEESDNTSADKLHETKETSNSCLTRFSSYGFGGRNNSSDEFVLENKDGPEKSRSSNPFDVGAGKDGKGNLQVPEDVQYSLSDFENDRMSTEENRVNSSDSEDERLKDVQGSSSVNESDVSFLSDSENHDEAEKEYSSSDSENQEVQNETHSLSGDSDNPDVGDNGDSLDEVRNPAVDTAETLDVGGQTPDVHLDSYSGDQKERPVIDRYITEAPSCHLTIPTEVSDQGHKSDQDDIPPTPGKLMDLTVKEESPYDSSVSSTSNVKGIVSKVLDFDSKPKEELKLSKEIVEKAVKSPKEEKLNKNLDESIPPKKVEYAIKDKLSNNPTMTCVSNKSELDKDTNKLEKERSQSEANTESKSKNTEDNNDDDDIEAAFDKQKLEKGNYYDKDILATIGKGKYYDKDILSAVEKRKYYEKDIMRSTQKSKYCDEDIISDGEKGKYFDKDVISDGEPETSVNNMNSEKVTDAEKMEVEEKELKIGDHVKEPCDKELKEEEKMEVDVCVEDKKNNEKSKRDASEEKEELEKPVVRKEIPSKVEMAKNLSKMTNKSLGKVSDEDKKDIKCESTTGADEVVVDATGEDPEQKLLRKKKKKRKIESEFRRKTSDIVKVEDVFTETESDSETRSGQGGTDPDGGEQNQDSDALVIDLQPSTREGTPASPSVSTATSTSHTSTISKGRPQKEAKFDLENLMKAFYKGWRREVVHRATIDPNKTNSSRADVYYYTPEGKKLRSKVEIEGYLQKNNVTDLTLKNFTWSRQPLGIDPVYETMRVASKTPQVGAPKGTRPSKTEGTPKRITVPLAQDAQDAETPAQLPLKRKRGRPKKLKDFEIDASTPKRPRIKITPLVPKSIPSSISTKSVVTVPSVTQSGSAIPVSGSFIQPIGTTIRTTIPIPGSLTSIPRIFHLPPSTQVSPVKGPATLLPKKNLKSSSVHMKAGNSTIIPLKPKKCTGSKVEAQKSSGKSANKQPMVIANQIVMSSHQCPPMPTEMKIRVMTPMLSEEDAANSYHCTPNCAKGKGNIPSLQCVKCVCLFHPECFAMPPPTVHLIISGLAKFLCPNCFRESKENTPVNQEIPARPQPFEPEAYDGSSDSESEDEGLGGDADFQNYNTVSLEPIRIVAPPSGPTVDGGIASPSLSSSQVSMMSSPSMPSVARMPVHQSSQGYAMPQGQPVIPGPNVGYNNAATGGHMGGAPRVYIINHPNAHQQPHQKHSYNQSVSDISNLEIPRYGTSLPFPHNVMPHGMMSQSGMPQLVMSQGAILPDIPPHGMMPQQSHDEIKEKKKTQPLPRQLFMELSDSYRLLLRIFSYLSVQDLLVVARVCVMWRDLAFNQRMWQKVRLRNCCVTNWKAMGRFLSLRNTQEVDMRKMVIQFHRSISEESGASNSRRKDCSNLQEISTNGNSKNCKGEIPIVKTKEKFFKDISSNSLIDRTKVGRDSDHESVKVDKKVLTSQTSLDVKQELCEEDQLSSNNRSQDEEENCGRKEKGNKNNQISEDEMMETEGIKTETDSQNDSEDMEDQHAQWNEYWNDVAEALGSIPSLKTLTLPNCSPKVVSKILSRCCKLKSFTALDILEKEEATSRFDPSCLLDALDVEELRIGSSQGLIFKTNFNFMKMQKLKTLVINDFKSSQDCPWPYLGTTLTTLELSSIDNFTKDNWSNIGSMIGLKKMRLVGGGCLQDTKIQGALMNLHNLHTLELLNFIISSRLAPTLKKLPKLRNLCLLPSFTSKVPMPFQYGNMMAVIESVKGLEEFVWAMQVSDIVTVNGKEGIQINRSKSEDGNKMDEEGRENCTLIDLMMLWKAAMPNSKRKLFKLEVMDRKVVNHFRVF